MCSAGDLFGLVFLQGMRRLFLRTRWLVSKDQFSCWRQEGNVASKTVQLCLVRQFKHCSYMTQCVLIPYFNWFSLQMTEIKTRWHAEDLFRKHTKVTIVKLSLFPVWVTRERQRAFLMCPAASRPPSSICHFVRPHKDATRSCVEGLGKGCRMSDGYSWSFHIGVFLFHSEGLKVHVWW